MTLYHRLIFHVLRLLDDLWPGWASLRQPEPAEYLSRDALAFWLTREGRR